MREEVREGPGVRVDGRERKERNTMLCTHTGPDLATEMPVTYPAGYSPVEQHQRKQVFPLCPHPLKGHPEWLVILPEGECSGTGIVLHRNALLLLHNEESLRCVSLVNQATYMYIYIHVHVLMRDEKEGRKKQARSNKQQGKATQHTQGSHVHVYVYVLRNG